MPEQFAFPFKREEKSKKVVGKTSEDNMPTEDEDEEMTNLEGGKRVTKERNDAAAKKALDAVLGKDRGNN